MFELFIEPDDGGRFLGARDWGPQFGYSVAIHRDTVIVGARGEGYWMDDPGLAFIFTREGGIWTKEPIPLTSAADYNSFGSSVAINEDTVIVGAPRSAEASKGEAEPGSAYIF